MVVAAGGITVWYRLVYNVRPGLGASGRVHWCGRDRESFGGQPRTWRQITSLERLPVRSVGRYPPPGLVRQDLFAASAPGAPRSPESPSPPCAIVVCLRTGPGEYRAYSLEGGP